MEKNQENGKVPQKISDEDKVKVNDFLEKNGMAFDDIVNIINNFADIIKNINKNETEADNEQSKNFYEYQKKYPELFDNLAEKITGKQLTENDFEAIKIIADMVDKKVESDERIKINKDNNSYKNSRDTKILIGISAITLFLAGCFWGKNKN